ncbi:MAG TPA: DUF1684 domain-containing protein [bacterium]|nr:DUF1684 domain-containing protein [bacterium]HPN34528.1 DUF1684 domain-containing protein [bacterium]
MNRTVRIMAMSFAAMMNLCSSPGDRSADAAYRAEIEAWHRRRVAQLTKPDGWLSLAGFFWLEQGENSFGRAAGNAVVFPAESCPDQMGAFIVDKNSVRLRVQPGAAILTADHTLAADGELQSDAQGRPTLLFYNALSWHIIQRGGRFAVRLRDSTHVNRRTFRGIDRFPVDPAWRVKAKFIAYEPVKTLRIVNVVGQVEDQPCPGALLFTLQNREFRLDVLEEGREEPFFVIFADATSGEETYGGGRFLYVARPDSAFETFIDFNKAYNPPCSFTPYATCPLPPESNRLTIAVRAGEKRYQGNASH